MPVIVYNKYNDNNLVRALLYNMATPEDEYYSFMIPAILAMIAGLKIPLEAGTKNLYSQEKYNRLITSLRTSLIGKEKVGIILIITGFVFGGGSRFLPAGLGYLMFLFGKLTFVGILYIYFSDSNKKRFYLAGGLLLAIAQSLASGIFGDLVYLSALSTMVVVLGRNVSVGKSLTICLLGFFLAITIQTIKGEYRKKTWGDPTADKIDAIVSVVGDKVTNFEENFNDDGIFPLIVRFNQGMLVDKVMNYVPRVTPYQNGKTIWLSLAASLIPRYIWPDKPEAGGHANMLLFTGMRIDGYSMNVSPYGEAWGNFGKTGGVIYMFFYGLFFNFVFYILHKKFEKQPTLILWIPYLFINSIQIETDTLLTVNSITKGVLFMWAFFFVFRRITNLSL